MKNLNKYTLAFMISMLTLVSCNKWDEYKNFIPDGAKVYPGVDTSIVYQAGFNRALLAWRASPDQRVAKYAVYWNNKLDSLVFNATSHNPKDTVKAMIENLPEGFYTFIIHSLDQKGNKSVPVEKNNVRIYGNIYQKLLLNRDLKEVNYNPDNQAVTIRFNLPNEGNVYTELSYTGLDNSAVKVKVLPDDSIININDRKKGTKIYYQSFYKPVPLVIDLFGTLTQDSIVIAD